LAESRDRGFDDQFVPSFPEAALERFGLP